MSSTHPIKIPVSNSNLFSRHYLCYLVSRYCAKTDNSTKQIHSLGASDVGELRLSADFASAFGTFPQSSGIS
jgi:hypothetical protein